MVIRPMQLAALAALAIFLTPIACTDPEPLGGCVTDEDCPQGLQCIAQACLPADPCAAGIYIGDKRPDLPDDETGEFPEDSLVRQVSGVTAGVSAQDNNLVVVAGGEPKLFEIDFYDEPTKNNGRVSPIGVFTEAKLRLLPGAAECAAVIYLWPDRRSRAKFCLGGGRIGIALGLGNSNNLIDDVDLEQFHTYRVEIKPATAGDLDGGGDTQISTFIELWIDGVRRLRLSPNDFVDVPPNQRPDRAPLVGFGAEGAGTSEWDFVRWGCRPDSGICLPDRQEDDTECTTERRNTTCGGAAVAQEFCDGDDNDCDGRTDEDFREDFADGTPISVTILGEERYLEQECGLAMPCDQAVVVCSDDKLGLKCDTASFAQPERCDEQDNDCDTQIDEDFRSGPGADTDKLWNDDQVGEMNLGLTEPCGTGVCQGGLVVCNIAQDGVTCSTRTNRLESDICDDGLDNNCNGEADEGNDRDGDGFQDCARCLRAGENCIKGHDCDDNPASGVDVNPGEQEVCNRLDDDCNGRIDEGLDLDGDGFLPCGEGDPLQPARNIDCVDDPEQDEDGQPRARDIFPGAVEVCDGVDNNCNGEPDEDFSFEANGRRFYTAREHCGRCGVNCETISGEKNTVLRCEIIENESPIDQYGCSPRCQAEFVDADRNILASEPNWHENSNGCECELDDATFCDDPNGLNCSERCDGRDNDCDGQRDEAENMQLPSCYTGPPNTRNVGICRDGRIACRDGDPRPEICVGEQTPVAAVERACDGLDEDCDGVADDGNLDDGSPCQTGLDGVCAAGTLRCRQGQQRCIPNTPQNQIRETCDIIDNDCDGRIDEDTDLDGDGFEPCRACLAGETPQEGVNFCVDDCNDNPQQGGRRVNPNAAEACNGEDDDCDRYVDEDFVVTNGRGEPINAAGATVIDSSVGLIYNSNDHCGTCGTACAPANGLGNCDTGVCRLVECRVGFLNLDGREDNGCETSDCREDNVGPDVNLIGRPCSKPIYNEAQACRCGGVFQCIRVGGIPAVECVVNNTDEGDIIPPLDCRAASRIGVEAETCDVLDNDCDGQVDETFILKENGRPVLDNEGRPIYSDVDHCGACNQRCAPPNARPVCDRGTCNVLDCNPGFFDIDHQPGNGCEYACAITGREVCDGVDNDCNDNVDETFNFQNDPNNCGQCGRRCEFANGVGICQNGQCRLDSCRAGFDDCNDVQDDGCETDLNNPLTCGGCNNRCDPVTTSGCTNQTCRCGANQPCGGAAAVCDDLAGSCTGCLDNGDCAGVAGRPFCVNNACRQCDQITHAGCEEDGPTPICVDGTCQPCGSDAQCTIRPNNRDTCIEGTGRCQLCDPVTNSGCLGNIPTCDAATFTCRACRDERDCLGGACVGGRCSGCDVNSNFPCTGATPICDSRATECRPCLDDSNECALKDPNAPVCVAGRCQICDPANHIGCGPNQLCCNFVCVNTNPDTQCESCGQRCNPASTNVCNNRDCDCGPGDECGGQRAFCNDAPMDAACVNCRISNPGAPSAPENDADCVAPRPECVNNVCEACDPTGHVRCNPDSTAPICDSANKFCRRCGADTDCRGPNATLAGFEGGECISDGSCRFCDPANNTGCDAAGVRPICGGQNFDCRACANNGECATSPQGNVCAGSGRCTPCANQAECAGHPAGNLCRVGQAPAVCDQCDNNGECATHPAGNRCVGGNCVACQVSADCAGNPAGNTCVAGRCTVCEAGTNAGCDGQSPICGGGACRACAANAECGANRFCIEAAVEGIQAASTGTCQRCDPVGDTGCDPASASPICDPVNFFCRVCAVDAECGAGKQCSGGRCTVCDPATDDGCDPNGATPICRTVNNVPVCTGCQNSPECADNARAPGDVCVANRCITCNLATQEGCSPDALCCDQGGGPECVATGSGPGEVCSACNVNGCNANATNDCNARVCQCGMNAQCPQGDYCIAGACVDCIRDADCGGNTPRCVENSCVGCRVNGDCRGTTPICDNAVCRACRNNPDCGQGSVCVGGGAQAGSCTGDRDNDGIDDGLDNCPDVSNANQLNTDMAQDGGNACDDDDDNDGDADEVDNCPLIANPDQLNTDGAGDGGNACDTDDDNDGILDNVDNCPINANLDQANQDGDALGDVCDPDRDGDTVANAQDNCPTVVNANQANNDMDAQGDVCDPDDDNDNVADGADNCPLVANADQLNTDMAGDGGNACDTDDDNDGDLDNADNCPLVSNADQANQDGDALGDLCDDDRDGDTIANGADNCPAVANQNQTNTDNAMDGGDACDTDDDNDGDLDNADNCPLVANPNQENADADALGDACDPDDDNDGDLDGADNCPLVANPNQENADGDAQGNACDTDDDNDAVLDGMDNCPLNANANQTNTDMDAQGDACDTDDDNDTVLDVTDNCPLIANLNQTNTDMDAQGDACDTDDDNDTVLDATDNCPLVANVDQLNTDMDANGNACDTDDDNDGDLDNADNCPLVVNANQADGDGDNVGDACDNCPLGVNPGQVNSDGVGGGDICDSPLIINEFDYAEPNSDDHEFIEIVNVSNAQVALAGVELRIVGANGATLQTVNLGQINATIAAGQYMVIGDQAILDLIDPQDGVLEAVIPGQGPNHLLDTEAGFRLVNTTPDPDRIFDSVAYEGPANGTAETAPAPTDEDDHYIARCPNFTDNGRNNLDFLARLIGMGDSPTPGEANDCN
jgi:hypothetical protein